MLDLQYSRPGSWLLGDQRLVGVLIALATGAAIYVGGIRLLAIVTAVFWLAAVAYYWPLAIAGLALLQSGAFFQFVPPNAFFWVPLGPGQGLNLLDVLVLVSLPFALLRLAHRHERPVFAWPVLLLIGAGALSVAVGLLSGGAGLNAATPLSRSIFYYVMYFVLVAAIDSRRKLDGWIAFVLGIMVVAIGLQLVEAITGQRLSSGLVEFGSTHRLSIGGQYTVVYLWNRAATLSFLGLMLALGVVVESRPVRLRFVCLVGLGIVSFALAFVRQWFVYVILGVVGVLLAQRTARGRGVLMTALIAGLLILVLVVGSPLLQASFGPSLVDAWLARATTIVAFGEQSTNLSRVHTMADQWDSFLRSPLVGHGQTAASLKGTTSSDVGITNTLVEMGLLGLLAVTVMWASFLATAFRVRSRIDEGVWRGYVIGLIGFWMAVLAGSLYGVNYFSAPEGVWVIVVALALLDRLRALHSPATEVAHAQ